MKSAIVCVLMMGKKRVMFFLLVGLCLLLGGPGSANAKPDAKWCGWHGPVEFVPPEAGLDPKVENQEIIARYGYEAEHSVEEIKDLLDPYFYEINQQPEKFGRIRINLTPTWDLDMPLWRRYWEATEKYKGTCKLGPNGSLLNYKAGQPFPDPKTGLEVYWNFYRRCDADDRFPMPTIMECVDYRSGQVRYISQTGLRFYYSGRLTCAPKPLYEPNVTDLDTMTVYAITWPRDLKGITTLAKRFKNITKNDQMWTYLPAMRRVRRMSTKQREDYMGGGSLVTWDNWEQFDGNPYRFNFKILEKKPMIFSHIPNWGKDGAEWEEGKMYQGLDQYYQKREVIVLEITPKDPSYSTSKFICYTDVKTGKMFSSMSYDRKGRTFLYLHHYYRVDADGIGSPIMNHIDMQRDYSGGLSLFGTAYNQCVSPDVFNMDALKKHFSGR